MRRRVVLHLLRRVEVVVPDGHRRRVSDAVATAKRRERRIRERDALRDELIVDPHQIAAAAIDPLEDLIVRLRFFGPFNPRHGRRARLEDHPHRPPGDLEGPGDVTDPVALRS